MENLNVHASSLKASDSDEKKAKKKVQFSGTKWINSHIFMFFELASDPQVKEEPEQKPVEPTQKVDMTSKTIPLTIY
jgi:hypothetical protein